MTAYYNEIDPYAAQWLRNLIAAGHIAPGDVDTRSILDVRPDDLAGYTQCHFFAGIGGWSLAARLAGWPDDRPLWTGSCPCQPFSVAGKGEGQEDERHLWPVFFDLIRACRPDVVMGEQVAAAVGKHWLDGVHSDLESIGYSCGATVVPACAVDAPHRRDRLWFVADGNGVTGRQGHPVAGGSEDGTSARQVSRSGGACDGDVANATHISLDGSGVARPGWRDEHSDGGRDVDNAIRPRLEGQRDYVHHRDEPGRIDAQSDRPIAATSGGIDVAHANSTIPERGARVRPGPEQTQSWGASSQSYGRCNRSPWDGAGWITGWDGKARRVEPSIRLLAHGVPARVGKLRAYGNAIVPALAAEIIGAFMDTRAAA